MSSLYQSMVAVIERSITRWPRSWVSKINVITIATALPPLAAVMIIGSFMLVFIFPPFSADTHNNFARGWLDFSQTYREQLMLPFNLSMGVMTFSFRWGLARARGVSSTSTR